MTSPLKRIKGEQTKTKEFEPKDFVYLHHKLLKHYGWIPLEEFRNLPIPTILGLLNVCLEEEELERKEAEKIKKKR